MSSSVPVAHWHTPPMHDALFWHALPHMPQF
jgi:hypothetical protein